MNASKDTKRRLALGFFTSLSGGILSWKKIGTIGRELQLYRKLATLGLDVHVFTIEREKDISWCKDNGESNHLAIHALYPNWLPYSRWLLVILMPLLLVRMYFVGRNMDVLKTNQGHSGIHVMLASWLWHRPYISRSGYILSEQLGNRGRKPSFKDRVLSCLERVTMRHAIACFVPTPNLVDWCKKNIGCRRLELMPNNVDTELFCPSIAVARGCYVIAVGRVVPFKRYDVLVRACARTGVALKIVGDGPDCDRVIRIASELGCRLEMLGRISNNALPSLLANAAVYVICSEYEGHPKSLVEAMACGCACIGTDNPGIRNQIRDGENGILAEGTVAGLADAITRIVSADTLAAKIRAGARQYALENFSLDALARKEASILSDLTQ